MRVSRVRVPLEYSSSLPEHTKKKIEQRLSGVGIGRRQSKHSHMFTRTLTNTHSLTHSGNRIEFSHSNRNIVWIRFECLLCHHLWLSHSLSPFLSRTRIRTLYLSLYIIYVYGIWALAYSRHIVALAHFDAWLGWRTLWSSWLLSWPKFLWHSTRNCAWLQIS